MDSEPQSLALSLVTDSGNAESLNLSRSQPTLDRVERLEWTNEYESIDTTVKEIDAITTLLDSIIKITVKRNLHITYHTLVLANELLKRRAEYLLQVFHESSAAPSNRLTYPTCFLGEWLKFITIKKKVTPGICDYRCEQMFGVNTNSPPVNHQNEIPQKSILVSYPMGAPFHSGPSESAPKCFVKKSWSDRYELKYIHYAVQNAIDDFIQDISIVNILLKLSELLLVRYKTEIEYTPGVGNNILKSTRREFFEASCTHKQFML